MKQAILATSLLSLVLLAGCGSDKPDPVQAPGIIQEEIPNGPLPESVRPIAYQLDLRTNPADDTFSGTAEIQIALDEPHSRIWLHAQAMEASGFARLPDGTEIPATFEIVDTDWGVAKLDFESAVPAGDATLVLDYTARYNFGLAGLYKVTQSDRDYLATQLAAIDGRKMFPGFDEPRFKTPFSISVSAPASEEVITNSASTRSERIEDGWVRHTFETTKPLPTYLLALAVGPYDKVEWDDIPASTLRSAPTPLRGFAAAGKGDKLRHGLSITSELLQIQETYFDHPYVYGKLDLIAAPDFAYGAMENPGAIIYREAALLLDDRTTLRREQAINIIHAHELAHQWFGNLVTPKWWDDIWLNESFATWMSYKTLNAFDDSGIYARHVIRGALSAMANDSLASARQIRNPVENNASIIDVFDAITYQKGGGVLSMLESFVGEDAFRDGLRLHMKRFEHGVADTNDFMTSIADGSGNPDLVEAFSSFINQPGVPLIESTLTCDEEAETGLLTLQQRRYAPLGSTIDANQTWTIPFAAKVYRDGEVEIIRQLLTDDTTEITLESGCADWMFPNADGAGYWRFALDETGWRDLIQNFDQLSDAEQVAFADGLPAAFASGQVPAELFLDGIAQTTTGSWDTIRQPLSALESFRTELLTAPADRKKYAERMQNIYEPVFRGLNRAENLSDEQELLKEALLSFMAETARERRLRSDLEQRAETWAGLANRRYEDPLPPNMLYAGIKAGTEEMGRRFIVPAIETVTTFDNQTERTTILNALAESAPKSDLDLIFGLTTSDRVANREAYSLLLSAARDPDKAEAVWSWVTKNFDTVVDLTPRVRLQSLPSMASGLCHADAVTWVETFFAEHGSKVPGYERSLAQTVERISLCAALKAETAASLSAAVR